MLAYGIKNMKRIFKLSTLQPNPIETAKRAAEEGISEPSSKQAKIIPYILDPTEIEVLSDEVKRSQDKPENQEFQLVGS